jgi:PelA/Pel-15E family pectate lyase
MKEVMKHWYTRWGLVFALLLRLALNGAAQNANYLFASFTVFVVSDAVTLRVNWRNVLRQKAEWYGSEEAAQIADNVLLYQRHNGGWDKNIDMAVPLAPAERAKILADKGAPYATIDNGATVTQLHYLAKVFNATQQAKYKDAFLKGVDYLLAAQYANGGWPQYYPLRKGYYTHITYNDNAMIGVMELLRALAKRDAAFAFVDEARRAKAEQAIAKGLDVILKTQVVVKGQKTVWCAQHDETTLAPAPARSYEKISLSGSESVGIVRYLMSIENPTPEIRAAINAAVAWFEQAKLTGIKVVEQRDESFPRGFDRVVIKDEKAPPLWARFYDLQTNRPIFCGRDGIIKSTLAEIEHERRVGYSWYTNAPAELLLQTYPAWQAKQTPKR